MPPFVFRFDSDEPIDEQACVVRIGPDVATREQLFQHYRAKLGLPDYFGENWDALDEALRDLHWVKPKRVVIEHEGMPRLSEKELRTYLTILARAVEDWTRDADQHEVAVVFPADAQLRVLGLLKAEASEAAPGS